MIKQSLKLWLSLKNSSFQHFVPRNDAVKLSGLFFLLSFLSLSSTLFADSVLPDRKIPWQLDENYRGPHQTLFNKLRFEIPVMMRQTLIDMSVRLGLDFSEGWRYPLYVGFVDGSPLGAENVLAYVQLGKNQDGFLQVLNINLEAFEKDSFDYKKVFAHELIHAMLNDELGGNAAMSIPAWLHEGLAVYGADQGEKMLKAYVYQNSGFADTRLLNGLENHGSGWDYAEDYLAIKYIATKKGVNNLHNFVRETIKREGDYKAALSYTCFESWDEFLIRARQYSLEEIQRIGPSQAGHDNKPY